ncbi:MAG: outer membrane protein assembly factor BamB [Burkholderiaceae bacterium]
MSKCGNWKRLGVTGLLVLGLSACGSAPKKPQPAPLPPPAKLVLANQVWTTQIGEGSQTLSPLVAGGRLFVASAKGAIAALNPGTGQPLWRVDLGLELGVGVGSDGQTAAVISRDNELIAVRDGRELWRTRLPARSFTAPLVAGGRVFVLMADRSVSAYDGSNGVRIWTQSRPGEPLVLGEGGVLLPVGNTLVAGLSARLTGLDPLSGNVQWQALLASSRGTNEVERLVDLVGNVSRVGDSVCARAFSAAVGCVDTSRGLVVWSKPAKGTQGLGGDAERVFGTETDGSVQAWNRANGEPVWRVERFKYRDLGAPVAVGRVVVVGDSEGNVHVLSREDGSDMARLTTDGAPILGAPVVAGQVLIAQTLKGGVFAWRPQ